MKYLRCLADLVLPRSCVVCGCDLSLDETVICGNCLADLPLCRYERLSHNPMADRLNAKIEEGPYLRACALFFYRGDYSLITPALKYRSNFAVGRHFSRMLGGRIADSPLFCDVDCVIPVPLHWRRELRRGYNQAEVIAAEIAASLGAALQTRALKRVRATRSQTSLKGKEKGLNVKEAFRASPKLSLYGRHILLVDDVFTSGSTLSECCRALQQVLPSERKISVATLAFVYD